MGAGLAGLRTARLLARRELNVMVVDRRRSLSTGIRTTGIFVRRTLDDFDLPDHLLGPGVRDVLLYPPSRRAPIRLTSDRDEYRVADMAAVYEHARRAAESAGARVLLGVRYVERVDGFCAVRGAEPVTARFIVGADGARSRVARDLGLDVNRRFLVGAEIVHPIASGHGHPGVPLRAGPPDRSGVPGVGHRRRPACACRRRGISGRDAHRHPPPAGRFRRGRARPCARRPGRSSVEAVRSRSAVYCDGWRAPPGCSSETRRARCRR